MDTKKPAEIARFEDEDAARAFCAEAFTYQEQETLAIEPVEQHEFITLVRDDGLTLCKFTDGSGLTWRAI